MSIAGSNSTGADKSAYQNGDSIQIGDLLQPMPGFAGETLNELPHLDDDKMRAAYAAKINLMMQQFAPCGHKETGRARKRKIIDQLEAFVRRPPVTIDVPPIVWRYLHEAATLIAGKDETWDSSSGPLIAASNAHLKHVLGWNNARHNLKRLAEFGLAVPHSLAGNGKRYFVPGKDGNAVKASGWSLAPLLLLEDYLDELEATENSIARQHLELPKRITEACGPVYKMIEPFLDEEEWAKRARKKLEAISAARRKYERRSISACAIEILERLSNSAVKLLDRVTNILAEKLQLTDKSYTRVLTEQHHLYNPDQALVPVGGLATRRSGDRVPSISPSQKEESSASKGKKENHQAKEPDTEDPYGIKRSGFSWDEAPALFPFLDGLIDLPPAPNLDALHHIARMSTIAQKTAARSSGEIGVEAALLCALITGQHLADGEIHKSADAYMAAMTKRARKGELNLGHSLFGRREAVFGRREKKSSKSVNHMQRTTH